MKTEKYNDENEALQALSEYLIILMKKKKGEVFNLALSGGETAKRMFSLWANKYNKTMDWDNLRFYWVDERCVPKDNEQSNYGHAKMLLFDPLRIPKSHIHRIKGENYPYSEATRYSRRVEEGISQQNSLPHFDCIILGVGNDAHTASIFPDSMELLTDKNIYAVSQHPETKQYRITMTGPLILNNTPLLVPILGKGKKEVIKKIKDGYARTSPTPATYILSKAKNAIVYISDEESNSLEHDNVKVKPM